MLSRRATLRGDLYGTPSLGRRMYNVYCVNSCGPSGPTPVPADRELRSASRLGRVRLLIREFMLDVRSLWRYGAPFPTFLKLIGTLILCLLVVLPLIYPVFVVAITYFTYERLFMSWWLDQPWQFMPSAIAKRAVTAAFQPCNAPDVWKVREVLTRGILLTHSLATSIDYLCVMQGLLDEA